MVLEHRVRVLDLGGIPVRAEHLRDSDPLVVAGGHCAYNPEPLADFVDAFVIGDGEEAVGEINAVLAAHRETPRGHELRELAQLPGVYIPSLYDGDYDGPVLASVRPRDIDGSRQLGRWQTYRTHAAAKVHNLLRRR